jgi:hypothetical protein
LLRNPGSASKKLRSKLRFSLSLLNAGYGI